MQNALTSYASDEELVSRIYKLKWNPKHRETLKMFQQLYSLGRWQLKYFEIVSFPNQISKDQRTKDGNIGEDVGEDVGKEH